MSTRLQSSSNVASSSDVVGFINATLRPDSSISVAADSPLLFEQGPNSLRRVVTAGDGSPIAHAAARIDSYSSRGRTSTFAVIGAVATSTEHRQQGLATVVLEDLISDLALRGVDFAVLWSDVADFYERFGFARSGRELLCEVPTRLFHVEKGCLVRKAEPEDLPRIAAIHSREPCHVIRTESMWRAHFGIPGCDFYVLESFGSVEGYAVVGKGHDLSGCLHEWSTPSNHVTSLVGGVTRLRRDKSLWLMSAPWKESMLAPFAALGLQVHEGVLGMVRPISGALPEDFYLFGLDSN